MNLRLVGRAPASQKKSLYVRVLSDANGADGIRGDVEALHLGRVLGAVLRPDRDEDPLVKFKDGLRECLAFRAVLAEIERTFIRREEREFAVRLEVVADFGGGHAESDAVKLIDRLRATTSRSHEEGKHENRRSETHRCLFFESFEGNLSGEAQGEGE